MNENLSQKNKNQRRKFTYRLSKLFILCEIKKWNKISRKENNMHTQEFYLAPFKTFHSLRYKKNG